MDVCEPIQYVSRERHGHDLLRLDPETPRPFPMLARSRKAWLRDRGCVLHIVIIHGSHWITRVVRCCGCLVTDLALLQLSPHELDNVCAR